jgi:hypothetical protein
MIPERVAAAAAGGTTFTPTTAATTTTSNARTKTTTASQVITVQSETVLPAGVTVRQARGAWLEYCWKQGGGIMVPTFAADDDEVYTRGTIPKEREFLVPYGLKQEIVPSDDKDEISYRTVRRGPFWQDVVPGSHKGTVRFLSDRGGNGPSYKYSTKVPPTRMIWRVEFQVITDAVGEGLSTTTSSSNINNNNDMDLDGFDFTNLDYAEFYNTRVRYVFTKEAFWRAWTKFQLETATQNFKSFLKVPGNVVNIDHTEPMPMGVTPRQAMDGWFEYVWRRGGGGSTLFPPPVTFRRGRQRWIVPAFLEEEIVSMDYDESMSIVYRVNNPNPFTYPVHNHQSTVRFVQEKDSTPTQLLWNVRVQPYRKCLVPGVYFWTKSSMVLASRNLRLYLQERQEQERRREEEQQQRTQIVDPPPKKQSLFALPNLPFGMSSSSVESSPSLPKKTLVINEVEPQHDKKRQGLFPFPNLSFGTSSTKTTVSASPSRTLLVDEQSLSMVEASRKKQGLFPFPSFLFGPSASENSVPPSSPPRGTLIVEKPQSQEGDGRRWWG